MYSNSVSWFTIFPCFVASIFLLLPNWHQIRASHPQICQFANLLLSEANRLFLLKDTSLGETVQKYSRTAANENSTENG